MDKPVIHLLLKHLHEKIAKQTNYILSDLDVTFSQGPILKVLSDSENNTTSLKNLEKELGLAQSTVAGLVSRLEQKEFVVTKVDELDKRVKLVCLTDRGIAVTNHVRENMGNFEEQLFEKFSDEEKTQFIYLVQKLIDN
ncbi:MAG: hypothetical protein ATN35_05800 [Epulopiscium sp. Nele67-Bin004]|nr:MAG: hypothetical protein ATN35_05800 [Epulopiscium sp. Nele67-Bin004]